MIKDLEIFGEKIPVKNYLCVSEKNKIIKGDYKFNLYIKITDYCNAKCQFCSNQSSILQHEEINLDKLEMVLKELSEKNILERISITGGEPLLYIERLNIVLNKIFDVLPNARVTINTNGIQFKNLKKLDALEKIDGIHISRHHYNDEINDKIFGVHTATLDEITDLANHVSNKHLIRLNCLLMKGFIDSKKEVQNYLEAFSNANVFRIGFVGLMPVNQYSIEKYVDINDIFQDLNNRFFDVGPLYDANICECRNGLYLSNNGKLIEYYARMTKEMNCDYMRQLVYTPYNDLSVGFNKKKIKIPY